MPKIIIGFSKPKNHPFPIMSWLIRLFQGWTPYSQAYVRWYREKYEQGLVYEASGSEVKFLSKEIFDKKAEPVEEYELEISSEQKFKLVKFCMENAGVKYAAMENLGIAFVKIMRLFGKEVSNPFGKGRKRQKCSELVITAAEHLDILHTKEDLDKLDVKDVRNMIAELPDAKRIF